MYKWITSHLLAESGVWGNIASFHGLRFKPLLKLKAGTLSSSPILLHRKKVTLVKTRYWLWKMRKIEVTRDMALIFYNTLLLVYHTGNTSLLYLSDCLGTAALRKGLKIMNIHSWLITSCSDCFNDKGFARWKIYKVARLVAELTHAVCHCIWMTQSIFETGIVQIIEFSALQLNQ